jgi:hypothetical protein
VLLLIDSAVEDGAESSGDEQLGDVIALMQDDEEVVDALEAEAEAERSDGDDDDDDDDDDEAQVEESDDDDDEAQVEESDAESDSDEDIDALLRTVATSFEGGLDRIVRERHTEELGLAAPKHNIE